MLRCSASFVHRINAHQLLQVFYPCFQDYERKQTTGPQPATRFRKKKVMKEVLPDDTDFYEDPSATLTWSGSCFLSYPVRWLVLGWWFDESAEFALLFTLAQMTAAWRLPPLLFLWMATTSAATGESLRVISWMGIKELRGRCSLMSWYHSVQYEVCTRGLNHHLRFSYHSFFLKVTGHSYAAHLLLETDRLLYCFLLLQPGSVCIYPSMEHNLL